jgi:DNA mismatch repair protein MutH
MKTHTVVKSIRINKKRQIKEKISFPTFEIADVINQEWEESEVFRYLSEQRFLLQIFVEEEKGYVYAGHLFLKFTPEQLDEWAKETWEDLKSKVVNGIRFTLEKRKNDVIIHSNIRGKTENQMGLIKVHGQSTYDIDRKNIIGVDEVSEQYIEKNTVNGRFVQREEKKDTFGCELPNGDVIGKQSYWLNNDFVLNYIKEHSGELAYNIAWEKK